jgi:hypothetical protein
MSPFHSGPAVAGRWRLACALPGKLQAALLLAALAAPHAALAQAATRPDPLDPQAHVSPLRHVSSLARDRRPGEDPPVGWREANDTVARIGGWRAYAREAQQPSVAPAKPMPAGHAGHKSP